MDLYKVILAGQYVTYDLESDQIAPTIYRPGDVRGLEKGQARGLEIQAGSWHLEYWRGPTLTAMPFGLIDTVVSSLQLRPLASTSSEFTKFIGKGLRRRLQRRMAR